MTYQVPENLSTTQIFLEPETVYGTNASAADAVVEQIANALNVYYTPILIVLGAIGNLLSVFVFYKSKLRIHSSSQYLIALALSDTVFLFQLLPPWLNAVQFTAVFHHKGYCQLFVYISYVTCCLSAWLVVAFTVERFVAVLYPLRRNILCSVTRARHVIGILVVAAILLNAPVLHFTVPEQNDCTIGSDYIDPAARFNLVDTALSFTAPLGIITVLNSCIMVGVCRLQRARNQLIKAARQAGRRARLPPVAVRRSQQRITRMLLTVSSVFVLLNLPAYTTRILAYANAMNKGEYTGRWAALQQLALMFFNTNFGINFPLYCLGGHNFRRALQQTVPWMRQNVRRAGATRRASSHPARANSISTSIVSNGTDAASNYGCPSVISPAADRQWEPEPDRWSFHSSRQQEALCEPAIELEIISRAPLSPDDARLQSPPAAMPEYRVVPFNLFPYRNLIRPRAVNQNILRTFKQ